MTLKTLYQIILRIFGLYTVTNLIFNFLPQQITYLLNANLFFPFESENASLQTLIYLIIIILLIITIFYLLVMNPNILIKNLLKNVNIDEKINFGNLDSENLLKIAILSIGVLVLFNSLPELFNQLFILMKINDMNQNINNDITTIGIKYEIYSASAKTILGLVFIIFQNKIGKLLYK